MSWNVGGPVQQQLGSESCEEASFQCGAELRCQDEQPQSGRAQGNCCTASVVRSPRQPRGRCASCSWLGSNLEGAGNSSEDRDEPDADARRVTRGPWPLLTPTRVSQHARCPGCRKCVVSCLLGAMPNLSSNDVICVSNAMYVAEGEGREGLRLYPRLFELTLLSAVSSPRAGMFLRETL